MPTEQTTTEPKERLRSASRSTLPTASLISDSEVFKDSVRLLKEAVKLQAQISTAEDRLKEIKEHLAATCEAYNLKGMKYGLSGFEYRGYTARSVLSKEALLEAGVDPQIIADSYRKGNDFLDARFVVFDIE